MGVIKCPSCDSTELKPHCHDPKSPTCAWLKCHSCLAVWDIPKRRGFRINGVATEKLTF